MSPPAAPPSRAPAPPDAGQALTEYALGTAALLLAVAGLPLLAAFGPRLLEALDVYLDGFSYCWALPLP